MKNTNIDIKQIEASKFGGRLAAYDNSNKAIGWLRYHIDFDDGKMITITDVEILDSYKNTDIEDYMLSYIHNKYSIDGFIIEHDYKSPCT